MQPVKEKLNLRPDMRPETNDERLARRTAELRGHNNANLDETTDKYQTPPAPPGWSYEWKMKSVNGWIDPTFDRRTQIGGWEPVEAKRHPELMPKGTAGAIEIDGMVLCERPLEITKDRQARDLQMARQQVQIKAGQLDPKGKGGIISREDAQVKPKISSDFNFAVPEQ